MDESVNESLREDASRNRALALYEGIRDDDLVSEEVDERVLRLLGLDDVFDIDYGTYMTLLREKMVQARMVDRKLSTEETMLITEEFKRVKGKVGRFKLKKKKITAENLGTTGPIRVSKQQYYLTSKAIVPELPVSEDNSSELLKNIVSINKVLVKILESIGNQNKIIKKGEDTDRKRREDQKRRKVEEGLEKGLSKVASIASKILAPVQSILDKILNFILYTLLGRAFVAFVDWFGNPKNKEKVEVLKRFLKDWWPALLGGLVLFTTPFGAFVRRFIGTVTKLTFKLARFAIPKLLGFVKRNPRAAALIGAGTAVAGAGIYMQSQREGRDKELQKSDPNYGKTPSPTKSIIDFGSMGGMQFSGGGMIPLPTFDGGGPVDESTGITVTGAGPDTQATVLQPGEIVFSKPAVDYWGADRLLSMNKMGGGTNAPKFVNNIQMASGGGMIGGMMKGIGSLFGTTSNSPLIKSSWHGPAPTYDHKSKEVKAILRALKVAEGTIKSRNPYDTVFGGSTIPVSQMTVKELMNTQMTDRLPKRLGGGRAPWPKGSVASGAYQFMPNTLKQLLGMNVLRPSDKMTPDNQDRAAWALMQRRGLSLDQLRSQGLSRGVLNTLAPEWASLPTSEGKSYYGQPVKSPDLLQKVYNQGLKLGPQSKLSLPGPPVTNTKSSLIELPPVIQQANQKVSSAGGTNIPSIMQPDFTLAAINASIYGIA